MPIQSQFPNAFFRASTNGPLQLFVTTTMSPQTVTFNRVMAYEPFRISWGDDTETEVAANRDATITHSYATPGTYIVSIEKAEQIHRLDLVAGSQASCEAGEMKKLVSARRLYLQNLPGIRIAAGELGRLRNLTELYMHGLDEANVHANPGELVSLSQLESLTLFKTKNVPLAVGEIRNCPNLKALSISGDTAITKFIGEGDLSTLTQLQSLSLNGLSVATGYGEIGSLVNLASLSLQGQPNLHIAPGEIGGLTLLTNLNLNGMPNVETGPGEFASLTNLTTLFIWFCALINPDAGLSSLLKLTALTWNRGNPPLSQAECDSLLQQIYEMGVNRIATGGTITIGGQSISLPDGPVCPPSSGGAYRYELLNNSCGNYPKPWATVTMPALAEPVMPDELEDLGALITTSRLRGTVAFDDEL